MPRRNKNKNNGSGIVSVAFKSYLGTALTAGVATLALSPANMNSGSITAIYTGFELYRFKKLKVHLLPRCAASTLACAFTPDATIGSPASIADVMAQLDSAIISSTTSFVGHTSNQTFSVKPIRLQGQVNWYKCVPDASDTALEQQGILMWFGTSTEAVNTVLEGVIEFKNQVDPTVALNLIKTKLRTELIEEFKSSVAPALPLSWKGSSVAGDQSPISSGRGRTPL